MTDPADANHLDPQERRTYEKAVRNRDTIRRFLNGDTTTKPPRLSLSDDAIATLIRRARHPADDAYAQGAGGRGNDVSNPTLAAVLRDAGARTDTDRDLWQQLDDQIRSSIMDVLGALAEAAGVLELAWKRRNYVDDIAAKAYGRTNRVELCAGCNEPITGRIKRLDGQPYHQPDLADPDADPNCWWQAWRNKRPPQEATA